MFKRLPGRRRGVIRQASVWDAGDHLLSVSGTVFSERYRRFYYGDIKAIVVQKGPRLGSVGALLALAWLTLLLSASSFGPQFSFLRGLWLLPAAWLLFIAYTNFARSCRVVIHTAVSSEELPALFRRSAVAKALPQIQSKIEAAQGRFDSALSQDILNEAQTGLAGLSVPQAVPRAALYNALTCFLLIFGSALFAFWYRTVPLTPDLLTRAKIILCVLNAAEVITAVWALSKLFSIRVLSVVRGFLIAGLVLVALRFYALMIVLMGLTLQNSMLTESISTVYVRRGVGTSDGVVSTLIAIGALISLIMAWQDDHRGAKSSL